MPLINSLFLRFHEAQNLNILMMFAIIDVETTGRSPKNEKITEIAIYIHDGEKITEALNTLINPERSIPYYITQLTGISNELVKDAPKFYEVAGKIVELTENRTFVAHNVNFDYAFVRNEFKEIGYHYERKKLCTVQLSRKLIPGKKSYSLGKLCKEIGIQINGRHRASGDAYATALLFSQLMTINQATLHPLPLNNRLAHSKLNTVIAKDLPEKTGVYYFLNHEKEIIYIGKSKNIKNRVIAHLNDSSYKENELKTQVESIDYELTGSELIALLLESDEIKKHKPLFNRRQRRAVDKWGIFYYYNENDYLCFELKMGKDGKEEKAYFVSAFNNKASAREYLLNMIEKYDLCQKLCGLYKSNHACFHYHIGECKGACVGEETTRDYNRRARQIIKSKKMIQQNMIIIDDGRHENEFSAVKIENGKYHGFGYFDHSIGYNNLEIIHDGIKPYGDNHDVHNIINQYLRENHVRWIFTY